MKLSVKILGVFTLCIGLNNVDEPGFRLITRFNGYDTDEFGLDMLYLNIKILFN